MSRTSLIALAIGAYVAFAVVRFPANVAYRWFAPDAVTLAMIDGSVWSGSAAYGSVAGISFSNLSWRLRPVALLTGRLGLEAEARLPDGFVRTDASLGAGRMRFSDLSLSTALQRFDGRLPYRGVRGVLDATLARLEIEDGLPVAADGSIHIAGLAAPPLIPTQGVTVLPLGDYLARLASDENDGTIVAEVTDDGGPLELTGTVRLTPDRRWQLEAAISPRPDAHAVLVDGLKFLPTRPDGAYTVSQQGEL